VNTAEAIDRLRESPRKIRVLCPDGHFIANITLSVRDGQHSRRAGTPSAGGDRNGDGEAPRFAGFNSEARAAKVLISAMETLHRASAQGRRGNLAVVKSMTRKGGGLNG
jgi:hypothetical protein